MRHRYVLASDKLLESEKEWYKKIMSLSDENEIYADAIAFLSGCLRISKESIFTGLNNLNVISVMSDSFAEYFGFVESEVLELLSYYELEKRIGEVREWYDGYLFGKTEVYNPWSVICYLNSIITDKIAYPRPYWANTSSNSIIKELIDCAQVYVTMAISNREVRYIYETSIMEWFRQRAVTADFSDIYRAMLNGNAVDFETYVKGYLKRCISFYDEKETFYHGFVMGIMGNLKGYRILSNRETGNGRADIILKPLDDRNPAVIFELKYTKDSAKMEAECDNALRQIEECGYMDELLEDGCSNVVKYGICFWKKNCRIRCRKKIGHGNI